MLLGYARVSTSDQNHSLQQDALASAGCEKIFTETASGARKDRPQLEAALASAKEGDTLVVWKIDRLARSLKQLVETMELLAERGVGFRSLTDPIDTTTAPGRLIFHIFGALAEFERAMIQERTKAGLEAARARGRVGGRPKSLSPQDLERACERLAGGELPVKTVAREMGVSTRTLYRHLRNRSARGSVREKRGAPNVRKSATARVDSRVSGARMAKPTRAGRTA